MILSFHPLYQADKNLICAGRDPGTIERRAIQTARAVILPQGCRETLYKTARGLCPHVFPNYDVRFEYPYKIGQVRLFKTAGAPHPRTFVYPREIRSGPRRRDLLKNPPLAFPFVFKFDWGGEGETVFLVKSAAAFKQRLQQAQAYEKTGQYGFLLQEFIPSKPRALRVVVIHRRYFSYWRVQADGSFCANLRQGALIDRCGDPSLQRAAVAAAADFCGKTGINLAGFDFLFSEKVLEKGRVEPLFLEINYFFGRRGLGGSAAYYRILQAEIDDWIRTLKREP